VDRNAPEPESEPPATPPGAAADSADAAAAPDLAYSRAQRWLRALLQFTMLGGVVWAVVRGEWAEAVITALIMAATLSPIWLGRRLRINLPPEFELLAVVFLYASLFLGEFGDFYYRFWWWDTVLHTGSGFLLGVLAFVLVFVLNRSPTVHLELSPPFVALFAFCFAVACGGVWEIYEFTMDSLFGMNMQKSGLVDTMFDLIVDTLGALVVSVLGYLYLRHGRQSFIVDWVERFLRANPRLLRRQRE